VGTSPRWKRQTYSLGTTRVCLSSLLSVFSSLSSMWLWMVTRCRDSRLRWSRQRNRDARAHSRFQRAV